MQLILFKLLIITILFSSCSNNSSTNVSDPEPNQKEDFEPVSSINALKKSVLSIPETISLVSVASVGKKNYRSKREISSLGDNIYGKVSDSFIYANQIKSNLLEFLELVLDKNLTEIDLNTLIETEAGSITAYKLENISELDDEKYNWKLSLHLFFSSTPNFVCKFTFKNGLLKGQMLQTGDENLSKNINGFDRNYTRTYLYNIEFDGTTFPQTMSIDYTIDMDQTIRFAELYWQELTEEEKIEFDLGRISKASIRIEFDGKEFKINGSSYSEADNLENQLNRTSKVLGTNRSSYTYRAIIDEDNGGAKMEVAYPIDTEENIEDIFSTNSFATLFETDVTNFLKEAMQQYIDENDDSFLANQTYFGTALLVSSFFSGTIEEEKRVGFNLILDYLGAQIEIPTFDEHGTSISELDYSKAIAFWGKEDFTSHTLTTLAEVNDFLLNSSQNESDKMNVYYQVMAPEIVELYQSKEIQLTITQVKDYLAKINDFSSNSFLKYMDTNSKLVNPAFFNNADGFLGTYDGNTFYHFDFIFDTLTEGTAPDLFSTLNSFDLKSIKPPTPKSVFELKIEVK